MTAQKELLLVYPFGKRILPFCLIQNKNRTIYTVITPHGLLPEGSDVGSIDDRDSTGIIVHEDHDNFEEYLDLCDTVLFTDELHRDNDDSILHNINLAIKKRKNIILSIKDKEELTASIIKKCEKEGLRCINLGNDWFSRSMYDEHKNRLYIPKASIIFVGELMSPCNGIDIGIGLSNYFEKKGYRVSTILVEKEAQLFGLHSQDEFFTTDAQRPAHQQVDYINERLKKIDEEEVPDVIIVQIPGGMLRMNENATNEHGLYAYLWSQAVTPDCFVMCIPFKMLDSDRVKDIDRLMYYRYGYNIDAIHMSNNTLDQVELATYFHEKWYTTSKNKVIDYLSENKYPDDYPVFCALSTQHMESLCQLVEKKLIDMSYTLTI